MGEGAPPTRGVLMSSRMKPTTIAPTKSKSSSSTSDASDIAARYLVYKLFDLTKGHLGGEWHDLRVIGERPETVARAVERGWVVVRADKGKAKSAALTDDGRRVARKVLR